MKSWIYALTGMLACVMAGPSSAQTAGASADPPPVPILKAPYHQPVFKNEYITLLNVNVPPGRNTGYHIHTGDSVSVNIEEADMNNQDYGAPQPGPVQRSKPGRPNYTDYRKQSRTHKASNMGSTAFHNVSFIFNSPESGRFTPSSRAGAAGYEQVMDNDRVRGWRLVLDPGKSAGSITQQAPGIRIVLDGGEIVESVPGQADRGMSPKLGEFFWQDGGVTRVIRNIGTKRIEFLEFELK
jgi:hypothetical protein